MAEQSQGKRFSTGRDKEQAAALKKEYGVCGGKELGDNSSSFIFDSTALTLLQISPLRWGRDKILHMCSLTCFSDEPPGFRASSVSQLQQALKDQLLQIFSTPLPLRILSLSEGVLQATGRQKFEKLHMKVCMV